MCSSNPGIQSVASAAPPAPRRRRVAQRRTPLPIQFSGSATPSELASVTASLLGGTVRTGSALGVRPANTNSPAATGGLRSITGAQ